MAAPTPLLPHCLHIILMIVFFHGVCLQLDAHLCHSSCPGPPVSDSSYQEGVSYVYRYRSKVTTALYGRNGLALDCFVEIKLISSCHLIMQIRNAQIKRLSPQKEHLVQRFKTLRESLERTRLRFSLRGGKVAALCFQEGEQVWALNVKRAVLSMLQTSLTASTLHVHKETDVYGWCNSRYERRGALLMKTRDLNQCVKSRMETLWPHSVPLTEDTSLQLEMMCVQRPGPSVLLEVNCTETVSVAAGPGPGPGPGSSGLLKTQTTSTLVLLRAQSGTPSPAGDESDSGILTTLEFENEAADWSGENRRPTPQKAAQSVQMLCSVTSDTQQASKEFLELVFQLRALSLPQLQTLWRDASFKCRNDWQPLLAALPACGSETCFLLLTDLMRRNQLQGIQAQSVLSTISLLPHPSPLIIGSINALLDVPELRFRAMLAASSLIHQLCLISSSQSVCTESPQVQTFMQTLENSVKDGCDREEEVEEEEEASHRSQLIYALKSVGNVGFSASTFTPLLSRCIFRPSTALELRLAAIQAFRRFPCSADRSVLLQLYGSSQEDVEVRVAAYQQLMRCPHPGVFEAVKTTLRGETSSQVGSFVWSHLMNLMRSDDPVKQTLVQSLPDDIISRDFEAEFLKYSSYSDFTVASGFGIQNVETSVIFSPTSFLPRSVSVNFTVYFHGRAHNLLEVELRGENAEPFLRKLFSSESKNEANVQDGNHRSRSSRSKRADGHERGKEACFSRSSSFLNKAREMFGNSRKAENVPRCRLGVKVFGNEVGVFTCEDLYSQINDASLSMAGLAVQLLKGQEVQLSHHAVLMTQELLLPSLGGVPIRMAINASSSLSLRLKGSVQYTDSSHFHLSGYIKPSAYVGLTATMGVDGALGNAAVEWRAELSSNTSLDGSVQVEDGRGVRVTLNTPEDTMDVIALSSRVFQLSGDHREEIKGPKNRLQRTTCTPKTWSKMIGWQLCSNASFPWPPPGLSVPPPGPLHLSLRLIKLDRGLHYYLLEAVYSFLSQRGSWVPREASVHLLLATPQSSINRDMSLDLVFSPRELLLRMNHPLKNLQVQGRLDQDRNSKSAKLELLVDGERYYVTGSAETQSLLSLYHLEAKVSTDGLPMSLSANFTRGSGRKSSFSATVKNVFKDTASLSVSLERRRDSSSRQYSLEAELLLPAVIGCRMLVLMEQKASLWSSALRLKYGLGGDARFLRQECYVSQRMRRDSDSNLMYVLRADHEFYCTNTDPINHKIHLRHEESPRHIKSTLGVSYGKHWDEINNKHKLVLSQSFKNQSSENHTSYTLEFTLQAPEKNLNYRTQLLHSHLTQSGTESSTHLKINYNNLMPLMAGLHWKSSPSDTEPRKWEGSFNMDTPWLYVNTAHKLNLNLNQQQHRALQLRSELTASRWLTIRKLILEASYRAKHRETEARLKVHTPAVAFLQLGAWCIVGKRGVKASGSLSSAWTPPLRGNISVDSSKLSHALQVSSMYDTHHISVTAALNMAKKSLKKASLKMVHSEPKTPPTTVEFVGLVEERRKEKKMYEKSARLYLRQPLHLFPHTLLLQQSFTVDLLKGLYILETKAGFHDDMELVHTLTLGYRLPTLFVCSALIHPFSSNIVHTHSQMCVNVSSNQTHKEIQSRFRVGSKDRLTLFGEIQSKPLGSSQEVMKMKVLMSNQLQLTLPSSASLEGDVHWTPSDIKDFDYQAKATLRVERQECRVSVHVNRSSGRMVLYSTLTHPFKSKIPKTLEVNAVAERSTVSGRGSSSVRVRTNGKEALLLRAQTFHFLHRGERAVELMLNVSQSLLLPTISDLQLNVSANVSSNSVCLNGSFTHGHRALLALVKASLKASQITVIGDLRHTMTQTLLLPPVLRLDGAFGKMDAFIEGQLRVRVMETSYSLELLHQTHKVPIRDDEDEDSVIQTQSGSRDWLCVKFGAEYLCVNVSCQVGSDEKGEFHTQVTHSSHILNATGVPTNNSVRLLWTRSDGGLSVGAELLSGVEHLRAELDGGRTDDGVPRWQFFLRLQHQVNALRDRNVSGSYEGRAHYQRETDGLDTGLVVYVENVKAVDVAFNVGAKNQTDVMAASLQHHVILLQGLVPSSLQMSCTGNFSSEQLLTANCYGRVEELQPVEVSLSVDGVLSGRCRAQLTVTVDGLKLLSSDLNISAADGHLALLLSASPPRFNQTEPAHKVDAVLTAQFKGPIQSASVDVHSPGWRVRLQGDVGGLDTHGGTKEARLTLKHTIKGRTSPALQVEAWGRLSSSQLRCSMAVNPELSSSLALIVQGNTASHSKDLMVKVVHNVPQLLVHLPAQLNVRSQLTQSNSSVLALVEVSSGRRRSLWAACELSANQSRRSQALEVKHSYPQLKPLPRTVVVRTALDARGWSYELQHGVVWGSQEVNVSALYSAPPALHMGNNTLKVLISCVPRVSSLDVTLQRSLHGRFDSVSLGWMRHGKLEQVVALSSWSRSEETNETKLELTQPFSSSLRHLSVHTLTRGGGQQTFLSWDDVFLSLDRKWQNNSSTGQACAELDTRQTASSVKGCVSVVQEGNSYSQTAALKWDDGSVNQSLKYQKAPRSTHRLQLSLELDGASPAPCRSHSLQVKVQTNLRDRLDHWVLLGVCPLQPSVSWSGSHRLNVDQELFYSQTRLSLSGRPTHCSFTVGLINSSNAQTTNITLFSESKVGNWSVEAGASLLSRSRGAGLQVQATMDHMEKMWISAMMEGRCFLTTAGFKNISGVISEDYSVKACMERNQTLMLDVRRGRDGGGGGGGRDGGGQSLGSVCVGGAKQRLFLTASGCLHSLTAAEERLESLSSKMCNKLRERVRRVKQLIVEFRRQSRDNQLLQELSELPLQLSQHVDTLLVHKHTRLLLLWRSSSLRHLLTQSLPRFLALLQHASILAQQELKRPLATLAGVYQDVQGQRLETLWREKLHLWRKKLHQVSSSVLQNPQLRSLSQASISTLSTALDLAGQQTHLWMESRMATALSGLRRRLSSVYKLNPCSVAFSVPLPRLSVSRVAQSGLMGVLLEEGVLTPLQSLAPVGLTAELYRVKRKLMDGPFSHQALLVASQFVVTFDGLLYELPASCPLLLAHDTRPEAAFTLLLLGSDTRSLLLMNIDGVTVDVQRDGRVKSDCSSSSNKALTHKHVTIRKHGNAVQVSNQKGASVSCDLLLELCTFTLDGWLHGVSSGMFGINDYDAGNDFLLPNGSRAENFASFFHGWKMKPECEEVPTPAASSSESCHFLFASPHSPLSSCFRVVDPGQFLSTCVSSSFRAPCRLAAAFVHLCQRHYVPLELPVQCLKI